MNKQMKQWMIASGITLVGCVHTSPPTDLISATEVSVRNVEKPEAMQSAPLEVKEARENLDQAKSEMGKKHYLVARRLAEKSLANAQLAQAKADAERTKVASEDATKGIETLRQETRRKTSK